MSGFLLAGVDNKIVKLDARDSKIVSVVSEPYYPRAGYECFSRESGRFAVATPEVRGSSTSYANMVYRWIQDWNHGSAAEVVLETTPRWIGNQAQVWSTFDESSRLYSWYLSTQDFNLDSPHLPLRGGG